MKYRVSLDDRLIVIVPGHFPANRFGDDGAIEVEAESRLRALNRVAHETGISAFVMKAEPSPAPTEKL